MANHSKEIIEISDAFMTHLKKELDGHDMFRMSDIEMIVLLAVTKGYEAGLKSTS